MPQVIVSGKKRKELQKVPLSSLHVHIVKAFIVPLVEQCITKCPEWFKIYFSLSLNFIKFKVIRVPCGDFTTFIEHLANNILHTGSQIKGLPRLGTGRLSRLDPATSFAVLNMRSDVAEPGGQQWYRPASPGSTGYLLPITFHQLKEPEDIGDLLSFK